MSLSVARARWVDHLNGVNPSPGMEDWLTDRMSLTGKLMKRCRNFRVQRLRQAPDLCLADEFAMIRLPRRVRTQVREVLLQCDGMPVVFAHTVVPLTATASDWPFFGTLGEQSLGTTLFGDPQVVRGELQFARLRPEHPLARRACEALGVARLDGALPARRCLYRRKKGLLLVTEVFLPAIAGVGRPRMPLKSGAAIEENAILKEPCFYPAK